MAIRWGLPIARAIGEQRPRSAQRFAAATKHSTQVLNKGCLPKWQALRVHGVVTNQPARCVYAGHRA